MRFVWLAASLVSFGTLLACSKEDDAVTVESFCAACIDADREHCSFWAERRSQAFLEGYVACGDTPDCLQDHLRAAGPDADQRAYASAYCEACPAEGCEASFFAEDAPGHALLEIGGPGLRDVQDNCIPVVRAETDRNHCAATHTSCVLDYRLDDARSGGQTICRTEAR